MKQIWQRIEAWLDENAGEILADLNIGGESIELEKVEKDLGFTFPSDFRASYYIHDGQIMYSPPLMGDWYLLSVNEIKHQWEVMKNLWDEGEFVGTNVLPDPEVKPEWWKPEWIPITYDGAGNLLCLDLDPAPQGAYGQIVWFDHMNERRECIAPSFEKFMEKYADDIESGKYIIDEHGGLDTHVRGEL